MKKIFFILILIITNIISYSQHPISKKDSNNFVLYINSHFSYGSTNMTNEFMDKFIFGGYINNELKPVR